MASSSSCPSHIKIKSGPIDSDVLWMQPKHVSEHVWNGKEDRKLHISDELSPRIKEKKFQSKFFLSFDNLVFTGL